MDSKGNIYRIGQEPEEIRKTKEEMILLNEMQAKLLESIEREHRHEVLREMKSKNHNAKRRAKKKIAKACRQRNRR